MTTHTRRFLLASLTAAIATPVLAGGGKNNFDTYLTAPNFNAADKARIAKATAYLQALNYAQGRFEQSDDKGRVTTGNWFLARPGKIRFEYDAPYSLLVVADGKNVNRYDPRLKSFDQFPLSETPLSLFLSSQIRFDQGVIVTDVSSNAQGFNLKARSRNKATEGAVVLSFAQTGDGPVTLKQWMVIDAQNRAVTVKLTSLTADSRLSPDLFVLNKSLIKK